MLLSSSNTVLRFYFYEVGGNSENIVFEGKPRAVQRSYSLEGEGQSLCLGRVNVRPGSIPVIPIRSLRSRKQAKRTITSATIEQFVMMLRRFMSSEISRALESSPVELGGFNRTFDIFRRS